MRQTFAARQPSRPPFTATQTFAVILGLLFFSALGGFIWGMSTQIARSPLKYFSMNVLDDAPLFNKIAIRSSQLIAGFWPLPEPSPSNQDIVARRPNTSNSTPEHNSRLTPPPEENNPPPEHHSSLPPNDLPPPGENTPAPETTQPAASTSPVPTEPGVPPTEHNPPPPPPPPEEPPLPEPGIEEPTPTAPPESTLDAETAKLLTRADDEFAVAWKYYLEARPESTGNRAKAMPLARQHLKATQQLYLALLRRNLPDDIKKTVNLNLQKVQQAIYWTGKFGTGIGR